MSRVTVGAPVECTDGPCGELVALVIDPAKKTITHYVVRVKSDDVERMVPTEQVGISTPDKLELRCTQAELNDMESFTKDELLAEYLPDPSATNYSYAYYYGMGIPDVVPPDPQYVHIQADRVPAGEVELRQGTPVHARDGHVGSVKTVVVSDESVITHFVLEGGHIGSHYELTLPVAAVDYGDDEGVHLKLSKAALHGLPGMPATKAGKQERLELVAKVFDTTDGAHTAHEYLNEQARQPGKTIRVREAAELVRDADGKARIVQSSQPSAVKGGVVGAAAGGLLTLLGGPIGLVAGAAIGAGVGAITGPKIDMGLPDAFLKRLETRLAPGQSALVVLVEHDFAEDLAKTLAEAGHVFGGQQIVDTLVQEMMVEEAPVAKQ